MDNQSLDFRGLWTWDHSTNWSSDVNQVESGCFNGYAKAPESFLEDYRRLMQMMCEHELNYLIIWGLFRDCHGGKQGVHELLKIARDCKVNVLAGVGVSAYGGVYWEGNNPYNLRTWLDKRPDLRAVRKEPKTPSANTCGLEIACPSKDENVQWHCDAVTWLMENFDIAGVNLETGDYGVCECEVCSTRSAKRDVVISTDDMADVLPPIVDALYKAKADTVVTYATYGPFTEEMVSAPPKFSQSINGDAICQWTLTGMVSPSGSWPNALKPPTRRSVGFSHWGSQWVWPNTRHSLIVNHIRDICQRGAESGLEGVIIHGEISQSQLVPILNYRAFSYFCKHPQNSLANFAEDCLEDLFGDAAVKAIQYLTEAVTELEAGTRMQDCLKVAERFSDQKKHNWEQIATIIFSKLL